MRYGVHHVQLACPPGGEVAARGFFGDVLGLAELVKPAALAARGGCWFRGPGAHGLELHIGVEADFRPAGKAHPGIVWGDAATLRVLAGRLEDAGIAVEWDGELEGVPMSAHGGAHAATLAGGMHRFYVKDPFGNRLEFLAPVEE